MTVDKPETRIIDHKPVSLQTAIAKASDLTLALTVLLKQETEFLAASQPPPLELIEAKNRLTDERNQAIDCLREMSAHNQPDPQELQALIELRKQDDELTFSKLEQLLAIEPENNQLRYHRAVLLTGHGRYEQAKSEFLAVLNKEPAHFGALNDFGNLLFNTGYLSAARTLYQQAVASHPGENIAHLNLANLLQSQADYPSAKDHYQAALALNPGLAEAHQGLAYVLGGLGENSAASEHRELGFRNHPIMNWPYRGSEPGLPVLILSSAKGGNIALKHILDECIFQSTLVFTEYFDADMPLPPHRLVFNAIGDADLCREGLDAADALLAKTAMPVINPPKLVKLTGRLDNAERLGKLPGVVTPKSALLSRTDLMGEAAQELLAGQGLTYPLLLRSPGFHTGQFFVRIETAHDFQQAVFELPGENLLVLEILDARNQQGYFHKYRVMFVDGELYPLHMAVSKHWKVHYFSAHMGEQAEARQMEAAFLNDMPSILGAKAMTALHSICRALHLDYAGIDFALDSEGGILLFEANATMIVPCPDSDEKWDYRRLATQTIQEAVRKMLIDRAAKVVVGLA